MTRILHPLIALMCLTVPVGAETLDGGFGRAQVDAAAPAMSQLIMRAGDGALDARSLLSPAGVPWQRGVAGWGTQAYTYVVGGDGSRYESRMAPADSVRMGKTADGGVCRVIGVKLLSAKDTPPIATENWTITAKGKDLVWRVERRWLADFTSRLEGAPALFFSNRPWNPSPSTVLENCVSTTMWYDPDHISAAYEPLYRPDAFTAGYKMSLNNTQVITDRDAWSILKLWTNWHNKADVRLSVNGGYLYRRGFFGWIGEAGAVTSPANGRSHKRGEIESVELRITPVDKTGTGYQLFVSLPDKEMESTLKSFYSSLLNGGTVNDQRNYDFGNESDGWYYSGSTWMQGFAISAGVPAPGKLSSRPFDVSRAFRRHLSQVLGTIMDDGRSNFGYDSSGDFVDSLLNNIIGARAYLVHSGDLPFIRQHLPIMERMISYFMDRRNPDGLFDLGPSGHWYYDAMPTSGVNANHNALFYRALIDLAEMERAAGDPANAVAHESMARTVKDAFNRRLWNEDAPNGPRYSDWVSPSGEATTYCADVCQLQPAALGIASPEQARKLVSTIDRRIAELEKQYGYSGMGSLSAYWPVPDRLNPYEWQRAFPIYMNCGSFLAQTYWEIIARIRAGDSDGALSRLRSFARGAREYSFMGNNWVTVDGRIGTGASDEPYLSDMVVVPAALVHGFLGINPTWEKLVVEPHLPAGWAHAEADVVYKGILHHIAIDGGKVTITPGRRVIEPVAALTWEVRPACDPEWQGLTIARHFATGSAWHADDGIDVHSGRRVTLRRVINDRGLLGLWRFDRRSNGFADLSVYSSATSPAGGGMSAVDGRAAGSSACAFGGSGYQGAADGAQLAFGPSDSFTLQCRFRTTALGSIVMVSKPESYCLYVKDGRLAAWVMQDGLAVKECLGSSAVADGGWHHAAATFDRSTQRLSLYLDGRLDTPDGNPSPTNPVDISSIGRSTSGSPFCIGGLGSGFQFRGAIEEASAHTGVLRPEDLSSAKEYEAPTKEPISFHKSGEYRSMPFDWGGPAAVTSIMITAHLNGGGMTAIVETSDDGFRTVSGTSAVTITDGQATYRIDPKLGNARFVRLRFRLTGAKNGSTTPDLESFRILGRPVGP